MDDLLMANQLTNLQNMVKHLELVNGVKNNEVKRLTAELAEAKARAEHIRVYTRILEQQLHACQHNEYPGDHPVEMSLEQWESLFAPTPDPEDDDEP